uniref:Uncharacterized protein n=1 Tax=Neobodo designis TaxID=312471 RepID=A0A7S1W8N8_NEODS|mmetsp:Transcript_734/g.2547  ORF Transcript_734/g.2547 Transcript_734/m.2547 type:complete len:163 (+) Transcript_734:82-570(+)|eukprot:CAMPEP_0174850038 /NCGR_PEP_ID=MMETSP1114-20130205/18749_1 /TAXON_ID=312471 /ORGANISM="Neobodo designis, Strain CCAP 1951/1" /LENGTH=162 /DNA_ID=CAMNT_0016084461 /DNA_START=80 /DNA_END=568 /DNA_ORIENTATION=+
MSTEDKFQLPEHEVAVPTAQQESKEVRRVRTIDERNMNRADAQANQLRKAQLNTALKVLEMHTAPQPQRPKWSDRINANVAAKEAAAAAAATGGEDAKTAEEEKKPEAASSSAPVAAAEPAKDAAEDKPAGETEKATETPEQGKTADEGTAEAKATDDAPST